MLLAKIFYPPSFSLVLVNYTNNDVKETPVTRTHIQTTPVCPLRLLQV